MRRPRFFSVRALLCLATAWALEGASATWCIARTGAPTKSLVAGLNYACSPAGGGDCAPIQAGSGLCFLPNTLAAHASYAYNSVFQRSGAAPGGCDFAGTATITLTDPSYGSCTYPASPSAARSPGSPTTRSPPGTNNDDDNSPPDLGPDDSDAEARVAVGAVASFMSFALSCFVYLHLR
uniref:Uncharacterized protein n=1 Tax=Avena sativa TaxID=4498 RepID=A0ACD5YCL6_AVESA